jgi:hypothetical protein
MIFWTEIVPATTGNGGRNRNGGTVATTSWKAVGCYSISTAVPGGGMDLPPFSTSVVGYFCKFLNLLYIFEIFWKNKYIFLKKILGCGRAFANVKAQ